jgi:hypothetical protein
MNFVDLAKAKNTARHGQWSSDQGPENDAERITALQQQLDELRQEHHELQMYFGAALRMLMIRDVFSAKELDEFVDSIRDASAKYANGHNDRRISPITEEIDTDVIDEAIGETSLSDTFSQDAAPDA